MSDNLEVPLFVRLPIRLGDEVRLVPRYITGLVPIDDGNTHVHVLGDSKPYKVMLPPTQVEARIAKAVSDRFHGS
jgi:hypothetical protein